MGCKQKWGTRTINGEGQNSNGFHGHILVLEGQVWFSAYSVCVNTWQDNKDIYLFLQWN